MLEVFYYLSEGMKVYWESFTTLVKEWRYAGSLLLP